MSLDQILFLLILAGGLYLFVSERLRVDVTAMLILLALVLTGVLDSHEALAGFASEPAIIVAAVFVISGGLAATGITERIGQWVGQAAGGSETRAVAVIMPTVAALASFTHHVMGTAMMLPILVRHARARQLPASRPLMPMSLAASLGTRWPGQYRFLDFLRIGLPLTVLIAVVSAWMARWLWLEGPLLPWQRRTPSASLKVRTCRGSARSPSPRAAGLRAAARMRCLP